MLPLDGVPQFTVLLLSMGFSVYVAQFIHRLEDIIHTSDDQGSIARARKYKPWLVATLAVFMLDNLTIFLRIGLRPFNIADLAFDLFIVSLIFLANTLLTIVAVSSYMDTKLRL